MPQVKANDEMRDALDERTEGPAKVDVARAEQAQLAETRRRALADAAEVLSRSSRWALVNTFTASVRGVTVEKGLLRVLAPNEHVRVLYAPKNGRPGLIKDKSLLAAAVDYASLHDMRVMSQGGRDPRAIRVDGGRGGSTEASMHRAMDFRKELAKAQAALSLVTSDQEVSRLIRGITDHVVLYGGHPLDEYPLPASFEQGTAERDRVVRATFLRQGLGALCQHFLRRRLT